MTERNFAQRVTMGPNGRDATRRICGNSLTMHGTHMKGSNDGETVRDGRNVTHNEADGNGKERSKQKGTTKQDHYSSPCDAGVGGLVSFRR